MTDVISRPYYTIRLGRRLSLDRALPITSPTLELLPVFIRGVFC
jgi:hypothetical protein